jgi:pyruvate dehydrogenase E2 component (dihydrolipoamide acetyltransferase)
VATEFRVPELGENVKGGDVLRVLVKVGDVIAIDQPVLELETDKATIEVPSSLGGKVVAINVKPGDKVQVGQSALTLESDGAGAPAAEATPAAGSAQQAVADQEAAPAEAQAPPAPPATAPATPAAAAAPAPPSAPAASGGSVSFVIPELGENVKGGDVLRLLVKVGDTLAVDQPVVELETDKATIEVPSNVAGKVTAIDVKPGDKVKVGQAVLSVERPSSAAAPPAQAGTAPATAGSAGTAAQAAAPASGPSAIVQGFKSGDARSGSDARVRSGPAEVVDISRGARSAPAAAATAAVEAARPPAPAAPSVRRLARELGIDIHDVSGSGPGGRISAADVTSHAKRLITTGASAEAASPVGPRVQLPDFSKWGPIDRQPMRAIRRKTAEHLSNAWNVIPHVTQSEKADITELEQLRVRFAKQTEAAGGKLTVVAVTLKVLAAALKKFPQFNASVDMAGEAIVYKQYVHIGVAVDTDRGLLVPVLRDVDQKGIIQLAAELNQLAEKARAGKLSLDEMQGGCFSISNLGGIGGTHFTPIVNHPEVAILGMSRSRMEPVWKDNAFVPRLMLPLSLSYDHRLIDGADAMRFLRFVVDALEQPFLLVLQ